MLENFILLFIYYIILRSLQPPIGDLAKNLPAVQIHHFQFEPIQPITWFTLNYRWVLHLPGNGVVTPAWLYQRKFLLGCRRGMNYSPSQFTIGSSGSEYFHSFRTSYFVIHHQSSCCSNKWVFPEKGVFVN